VKVWYTINLSYIYLATRQPELNPVDLVRFVIAQTLVVGMAGGGGAGVAGPKKPPGGRARGGGGGGGPGPNMPPAGTQERTIY
jgi:hypothetical protein